MKTAAFFFTCILLASVFTSCASSFNTSTIDPDQPVQVASIQYTAPYGIYVTGDGTSAHYNLTRSKAERESLTAFQSAVEKHIDSIAENVKSKAGITLDINRLKDELEKSSDAPERKVTPIPGMRATVRYNVTCLVLAGTSRSLLTGGDVLIGWQTSPVDEISAYIQFATNSSFNKTGKGELVPVSITFVKTDKKTGKVTASSKSIRL